MVLSLERQPKLPFSNWWKTLQNSNLLNQNTNRTRTPPFDTYHPKDFYFNEPVRCVTLQPCFVPVFSQSKLSLDEQQDPVKRSADHMSRKLFPIIAFLNSSVLVQTPLYITPLVCHPLALFSHKTSIWVTHTSYPYPLGHDRIVLHIIIVK